MVIEKKKPMEKVKSALLKIGKRNMIIIAAVLLVGVAVLVNWAAFSNDSGGGYGGYGQSSGMNNSYVGTSGNNTGEEDWYASAQVSRSQARDEALEVLQSVVNDSAADDAAKAAAYSDITKLAKTMESETNIETLMTAKGFGKCVAVINGDDASVIVSSAEALTVAQISQINEIVYTQAGIDPVNIKIICK